eukprot:scaffold37254_cov36-Phaeocystis_antarctica.AAC.1
MVPLGSRTGRAVRVVCSSIEPPRPTHPGARAGRVHQLVGLPAQATHDALPDAGVRCAGRLRVRGWISAGRCAIYCA